MPKEDAEKYVSETLGAQLFECSALENQNVDEAFFVSAGQILQKKIQYEDKVDTVKLGKNQDFERTKKCHIAGICLVLLACYSENSVQKVV